MDINLYYKTFKTRNMTAREHIKRINAAVESGLSNEELEKMIRHISYLINKYRWDEEYLELYNLRKAVREFLDYSKELEEEIC